jgi:hypothetical protein
MASLRCAGVLSRSVRVRSPGSFGPIGLERPVIVMSWLTTFMPRCPEGSDLVEEFLCLLNYRDLCIEGDLVGKDEF